MASSRRIQLQRTAAFAVVFVVAAALASVVLAAPPREASMRHRFDYLARQHTNQCALRPQAIDSIAVHGRLQGSCCTPMVYAHYVRQIRGLRAYRSIADIPADPYDISAKLARRLIAYDRDIHLTQAQQRNYDHAVKLAHEHGPCCCHCWRWTAFAGQAKYLLARRGYGAAQVARVWDLEDGCGG